MVPHAKTVFHLKFKVNKKKDSSVSLVPLLFYFYNLKVAAGHPTESTILPLSRHLT